MGTLKKHRWKIISVLIGPLLAFAVWAADGFVNERVDSALGKVEQRLDGIEKTLSAIHEAVEILKKSHEQHPKTP